MKKILPYLIALALAAFGVLTLFLSSSVIFDWFGIREREGDYVLFVVLANFVCSLIYLISVYGFVKNQQWTTRLLSVSVVILVITFIGLLIYIGLGGIHETKTVGAMIFRTIVSLLFTLASYFLITRGNTRETTR